MEDGIEQNRSILLDMKEREKKEEGEKKEEREKKKEEEEKEKNCSIEIYKLNPDGTNTSK